MRRAIIPVMLVAILAAALLPGCNMGLGKIISADKDFANFTSVDIEDEFDVKIVQSSSFKVTVSSDESFFDYITVSKTDDTLRIYLNPRHAFTDFTVGTKNLRAEITMPVLRGLSLSGATRARVSGFKSSDSFKLDMSGASSLDMREIEVGDAEFVISGASKVSGDMKAANTRFDLSGASKVTLKGSGTNSTLTVSNASNINLTDFILETADVKLTSASEATLSPKEKLDCVVSDASTLYFLGNPTTGNVQVTGASSIKHR